ncbi:MAG: lamin tail domain-containing protein [Kiritimatiellae bacterium]|nr:lamin tail domain-containing protein [Kiritimatiellia bacterium]
MDANGREYVRKALILACGLLLGAGAAGLEPVGVRLQRGLYMEEFLGDIDGALAIYRRVMADERATGSQASLARRHFDQCYLKRGDEGNLASAFIKITELMYDPIEGYLCEFIEIKNVGSTATRDLSDMTFKGIDYTFPSGTRLAPGQRLVLVKNAEAFRKRYPGVTPFGQYGGKLDSGGERITLMDPLRRTVASVRYNDQAPWPRGPGGGGFSLVLVDEQGDLDDPYNWRRSNWLGGSPGADDGPYVEMQISEILPRPAAPSGGAIELLNAGETPVALGGWCLSDSPSDYRKGRIPDGVTADPGQFVVLDEAGLGIEARGGAGSLLHAEGGELYLTRWEDGVLKVLVSTLYDAVPDGVSVGRHTRSDGKVFFVPMRDATLGQANGPPRSGPVVINEIVYRADVVALELVELYNTSGAAVALGGPAGGWRLIGSAGYTFPPGVTLAAGERLLVSAEDPAEARARYALPAELQIVGPCRLPYVQKLGERKVDIRLCCERPGAAPRGGAPSLAWIDHVQAEAGSLWPLNADWDGGSLERQDPLAFGNDPVNWSNGQRGGSIGAPNAGPLVSRTAVWRYEDSGRDLGTAWRLPAHDDSRWPFGVAPLGYGEHYVDTEVSAKNLTVYFRTRFALGTEPAGLPTLTLSISYDDAFVAYLNGREVARRLLPDGPVLWSTAATETHEAGRREPIDLTPNKDALVRGVNVLAVEVHQTDPASSDCVLEAELGGERPPTHARGP